MKLSVLIPCYNFENYIETSLLSAMFQVTSFDYEIIIIDDCSTDFSFNKIQHLSWLKKTNNIYGLNVKTFKNETNLGAFETIKKLHELALGEYIAFLDGDDFWVDNHKLQRQVDFLDSNPEYVMCFDGYIKYDGNGYYSPNEIGSWLSIRNIDKLDFTTKDFLNTNPVSTPTKMYRNKGNVLKDVYKDVKYLDWVINFELSKFGMVRYIDTVSAIYHFHGNGMMSSLDDNHKKIEYNTTKNLILEEYDKWKKN